MPAIDILDGIYDTVSGAPSPADSGTTFTPSNPTRWPDPATYGIYPIAFWPVSTQLNRDSGTAEIGGWVTGKSGSTLTITRATSARSVIVGDQCCVPITGQVLRSMLELGHHNLLNNSGFNLFQRQAPGTATARSDDTFGPDRWNILTQTAAVNCERSTGNASRHAVKLTQNQASAQRLGIMQMLEGFRSVPMRSRNVRFYFRAKCSTTTTLRFAILEWTGTIDTITSDVVLDWTSSTYTANAFFLAASLTVTAVGSLSVGTSWTLCNLQATLGASGNNLIVFVWTEGTAAQNVTVELTEAYFGADTFVVNWTPKNIREEIADCQRFYEKSYPIDTVPGTGTAGRTRLFVSAAAASDYTGFDQVFAVKKRTAPSVAYWDLAGNASKITEVTAGAATTNNVTPSVAPTANSGDRTIEFAHDPAGNIIGITCGWAVDAEL